jgi:hypothetical protein
MTTHYSYATVRSPSFIRQEVVDQPYPDWGLMIFDSGQFSGFSAISPSEIKNTTGVDIGDIESIYYVSDGKTLNVTFWLNSPFVEKPSSHIPMYNILVDADNNPSTGGDMGIDYRIRVKWDNETKTWQKITEEVSALENTKILVS